MLSLKSLPERIEIAMKIAQNFKAPDYRGDAIEIVQKIEADTKRKDVSTPEAYFYQESSSFNAISFANSYRAVADRMVTEKIGSFEELNHYWRIGDLFAMCFCSERVMVGENHRFTYSISQIKTRATYAGITL